MGLFHCPMGCAYYEDEPCIDCLLCLATSQEEMVSASKRIRDYLKSHAETRKGPSQKIAVCGKGGTGKTTAVVLMANAFRSIGYIVLVMDMDDSNPGLRKMLGFRREPKPLIATVDRLAGAQPSGTEWFARKEILVSDIPQEYLLRQNNLRFLMVGKIADPFQGCACSLADVGRDLAQKIILQEKEILLIDTEAGVESFGRGLERYVDTVVVMVEPSSESLALAEKISYMADGIGVRRVKTIPNKIPTAMVEKRILEEMDKRKIEILGTLYLDDQISASSLEGKGPPEYSDAQKTMNRIARRLLEEELQTGTGKERYQG